MEEDTSVTRCCENANMPFLGGTVWYCPFHLVEEFSPRLAELGINLGLNWHNEVTFFDIPSKIVWEGEEYEFENGELVLHRYYDNYANVPYVSFEILGDARHPHISGNACVGGNRSVINQYIDQLDFVAVYAQAMAMLCSYNPNDAYRSLVDDDECYECGSTYEVYECENCGRLMCEDHRSDYACAYCGVRCRDCEEYIPEDEILRCESCEEYICDNCARIVGDAVFCYNCEEQAIEDYERSLREDSQVAIQERLW